MGISKRSPNCEDCDCCELYATNFCEQLRQHPYLAYLGEEWEDDTTAGGNSGTSRNTPSDCYLITCPATNVFAEGVYNANFPDRRALFQQEMPSRYHTFYDVELMYDTSITSSTYNVGIELIVDYLDDDNWHGIQAKIDPAHSTGTAVIFSLLTMNAGTLTVEEVAAHTLPSAVFDWRGVIEVALNTCTSGSYIYLFSNGVIDITIPITEHNGKQFAMAVMGSTQAGGSFFDCDGVSKFISEHVRVYSVTVKRNEEDLAGCEDVNLVCCKCGIPLDLDVTFSGFSDSDCGLCAADLDGTYSLAYIGQIGGFDCTWLYTFDPYSRPQCTKNNLQLTLVDIEVRLQTGQKWVVELNVEILQTQFMDFQSCRFLWEYDEGIPLLSNCDLDGSETFTRLVAPTDYTGGACDDFGTGWLNLTDFCSTEGTVTVENG